MSVPQGKVNTTSESSARERDSMPTKLSVVERDSSMGRETCASTSSGAAPL